MRTGEGHVIPQYILTPSTRQLLHILLTPNPCFTLHVVCNALQDGIAITQSDQCMVAFFRLGSALSLGSLIHKQVQEN